MRNARQNESQARIKNARRNTNNIRYADDISLMSKSEKELKVLLMKVKKEIEKAGLKVNIQFFSMWNKFWTFKNPIFSSHFYSGVCWLLSPTLDSLFSTLEHLYFLLSPSLPNPILWIFVGVWAMENTLGTDNCVDLSLSSWVPLFSLPAHLYLLPPSPILHVTLRTSLVVPHGGESFHH